MKRILSVLLLTLVVSLNQGCVTNPEKPTREAIVFYTFADTWTVAHAAYRAHCERVVSGKVSKPDEIEIDAAWNTFRASFKVAFSLASQNWSAATPVDVQLAADQLTQLLRILNP